jgi:hypothetical protein
MADLPTELSRCVPEFAGSNSVMGGSADVPTVILTPWFSSIVNPEVDFMTEAASVI